MLNFHLGIGDSSGVEFGGVKTSPLQQIEPGLILKVTSTLVELGLTIDPVPDSSIISVLFGDPISNSKAYLDQDLYTYKYI